MVQAVRREHPRRRLSSYPNRPIPRVPLREPLLGAVRGGSPCPEPRRRCQSTQRGCPRGIEHGVSEGVPGSLIEVYCIVILTDVTPLSFLFLSSRNDDATAIYVDDDTRIQILDSMPDLPRADKEQCGAFIVSLHSPIQSWAVATTYNILPFRPPSPKH